MSNKILSVILTLSLLFNISVFFIYRGYNWPFGIEGIEALGGVGLLFFILLGYFFILRKNSRNGLSTASITFGLFVGLLWTIEISMNNLLYPPLPARDIFDNVFWAIIAIMIFVFSIYQSVNSRKLLNGIMAGIWSGFATGAVACFTALAYIVLGMKFILHDPLDIAEWIQRGPTSHTPSIAVYFAYQTLAGAIMHLLILGIIMGGLIGIIGGLFGKGVLVVKKWRKN